MALRDVVYEVGQGALRQRNRAGEPRVLRRVAQCDNWAHQRLAEDAGSAKGGLLSVLTVDKQRQRRPMLLGRTEGHDHGVPARGDQELDFDRAQFVDKKRVRHGGECATATSRQS